MLSVSVPATLYSSFEQHSFALLRVAVAADRHGRRLRCLKTRHRLPSSLVLSRLDSLALRLLANASLAMSSPKVFLITGCSSGFGQSYAQVRDLELDPGLSLRRKR